MARKPPRKATVFDKLVYVIIRMLFGVLRVVDIRIVALLGRAIGYLVWAAFPSRRAIVARNLRIAINPMLRGNELSKLVRQNIVRTCENMVCTFKTGLLTDKELSRALIFTGKENMQGDSKEQVCHICCIPHAGNWEMMARLRPLFPEQNRYGSLYRRLDNPALERAVYDIRTRYGCEMFNIKNGLKDIFRLAKDGGMLGVLSDQFTQQGIFLPYFGKVTGTTPLPTLIYKRRKENVHMHVVASRTIGLGRWEADFRQEVDIPDASASNAVITMAMNQALEKVQKQSILDGFWMHHRWKPTVRFAPDVCEENNELIRQYARLPFRMLICVPEQFEEATLVIPMMRRLQACRPDMQLTVIAPCEQKAFWKTQPYITYVVTTDEQQSPAEQLNADEIYKDGPFDALFMLSENARVLKNLQSLMPIMLSGMASNPLTKKTKFHMKHVVPVGQAPSHKAEEYHSLVDMHVYTNRLPYADATLGNQDATGVFIAPFSTLGKADSWEAEKWKELVERLPEKPTLIALESDREAAETMASELEITTAIVRPETVASVLGEKCKMYAVDGLLPQLASLAGCRCHVLMNTRLAAVYSTLGTGNRSLSNHTPCHPCYQKSCDQATPCSSGISVDEMLG